MLRALLRDGSVYGLASVLTRGLALLLVPLYTRVLQPAEVGALDLLLLAATLVNLTAALEVSQGLARFYPQARSPRRRQALASTAFWFTLACYGLFAAVALLWSRPLAQWLLGVPDRQLPLALGVLYAALNGVLLLVQNQFRWQLRSLRYAEVSAVLAISTLLLSLLLTAVLGWGLNGALLALVLGAGLGLLDALWRLRGTCRWWWHRPSLRQMLRFSAPLVPSGLSVFVAGAIDRLLLQHLLSLDAVGIYGVAFRLATAVGVLMLGVQGGLTPLIYSQAHDPATPAQLARLFRLVVGLALPALLLLVPLSPLLIAWLAPPSYASAAPVLLLLAPSLLLASLYVFAPGLPLAQRTGLILAINALGAGLNTGLNLLLIPRLGIAGAAAATLCGNAVVFALTMAWSQRLYPVPHAWRSLAAALLLSLALAVALTWMPAPGVLPQLAMTVAALALLLAAETRCGLLRREDWRAMARFVGVPAS